MSVINKTLKNVNLRIISSGSKVGNQLFMLIALVILPQIFPGIIQLQYKTSLTINIILALITSLFYEVLRTVYRKSGKDIGWILKAQLVTSVVLLTWFLHVFGRINGPFFVLYLLTIMESALNLNPTFVNLVSGIMIGSTLLEFVLLISQGEIIFSLYTGLQFFIRLVSLFFMRSYGISLAQRIISEGQSRLRAQEAAERLENTTRELTSANIKLKELSNLKDEFVSVASHELRAPMTTIKGYISMILEGDAGQVPDKVKEFLLTSYESGERMVRLINNMLNVSRIESGKLVTNLMDVQIEESIEHVVADLKPEADRHGLKLKYFRPAEILPQVRVDPDRIKEIVANLIGNAINYTARGKVSIRNQIEDGWVITEVEDTGVGISPENQKKLFKKFSQIDAAPLRGSGLGLYICKMLLNEFGGKIWLKSTVGKGTTFYFSLPVIGRGKQ